MYLPLSGLAIKIVFIIQPSYRTTYRPTVRPINQQTKAKAYKNNNYQLKLIYSANNTIKTTTTITKLKFILKIIQQNKNGGKKLNKFSLWKNHYMRKIFTIFLPQLDGLAGWPLLLVSHLCVCVCFFGVIFSFAKCCSNGCMYLSFGLKYVSECVCLCVASASI